MRDGDEAIVEDALRRAGIWDNISELPDGIYTQMTREFSEDAFRRAAEPKELYVVPGAGHVDLFDRTGLIPFDKLEEFFGNSLK